MTIDLKSVFESKAVRWVLVGLGVLIVLLIVFKMGEFVGSRKADFSRRWSENYERNFMGPRPGGPMGMSGPRDLMMGHGIAGSVVSVASSTFAVRGSDTVERVVSFTAATQFQRFRDTIAPTDLVVGDTVIVLGSPDDTGRVVAKFVRIVPELPTSDPSFRGGMLPR